MRMVQAACMCHNGFQRARAWAHAGRTSSTCVSLTELMSKPLSSLRVPDDEVPIPYEEALKKSTCRHGG